MKKRFILNLLVICVLFALTAPMAWAAEATDPTETPTEVTRAPDECGEGITWACEDGVLTITGDGKMDDFEENGAPWQAHKDEITEVVIEGKLTYIGAYAFKNYDNLLAVDFGSALYEIGPEAFASCDGLTSIWLPVSFKVFGEGAFQSCKNLEEIHSSGKFPTFRQNCLWETYVTIYYPAESPWGTEYIQQLEEAFKGRVEFLASDGTDHYVPTEPEESVQETTVPETVAPTQTQAPTEVPTEPATQPATEPEVTQTQPDPTEAPAENTAATEPPVQEKDGSGGGVIGLVVVIAVLVLLLIGVLAFGKKKGKYSK